MPIRRRSIRRFSFFAPLVLVAGCASDRPPGPVFADPPPPMVHKDIQVFRDVTTITFANTTAEPLPPGVLWINRWYSAPFAGLAPGETISLDLSTFRDENGDLMPAGGFFAIDRPDPVYKVEVETMPEDPSDARLISLLVVEPT